MGPRLASGVVARALQSHLRAPNDIRDGGEVGINLVNGVGPEITLVSRMVSTTFFEELSSGGSQSFGVLKGAKEGHLIFNIWTVDHPALPEVEFALGDAVGDSDGDGMGVVDLDTNGIGGGLIGVVEILTPNPWFVPPLVLRFLSRLLPTKLRPCPN